MICTVKWGSSGGRKSTNSKELRRIMMNGGNGIYVSGEDSRLLRPRVIVYRCQCSVLLAGLFLPVCVQASAIFLIYILKIYEKKFELPGLILSFSFFFLSFFMARQLFGPWFLFSFLNLFTIVRAPWTRDQHVARPLHTQNNTNTE
jgi:hypothetical protein